MWLQWVNMSGFCEQGPCRVQWQQWQSAPNFKWLLLCRKTLPPQDPAGFEPALPPPQTEPIPSDYTFWGMTTEACMPSLGIRVKVCLPLYYTAVDIPKPLPLCFQTGPRPSNLDFFSYSNPKDNCSKHGTNFILTWIGSGSGGLTDSHLHLSSCHVLRHPFKEKEI